MLVSVGNVPVRTHTTYNTQEAWPYWRLGWWRYAYFPWAPRSSSAASYYSLPLNLELRVLNDDIVDGGRGFGFTGGHNQINWAHDDFRKVVLNGLVWITGLDVPANGVPSKTPTIDQLRANMDFPDPGSWNWDRIQERIDRWNNR